MPHGWIGASGADIVAANPAGIPPASIAEVFLATSEAQPATRSMSGDERAAYALIAVAPALFASNVLVARAVADTIPPVALALGR